jgi:hypothetical protein
MSRHRETQLLQSITLSARATTSRDQAPWRLRLMMSAGQEEGDIFGLRAPRHEFTTSHVPVPQHCLEYS